MSAGITHTSCCKTPACAFLQSLISRVRPPYSQWALTDQACSKKIDAPGRHRSLIEQERTRRMLRIWHAMHVDAERTAAQTAGLCCLVRLLRGTDRHKERGADNRTGRNKQKPHGLGNTQARQPSPYAGSLPSVSPVNPRVGFSLRLRASPAPLFFLSFQLLRKLGGPEKKNRVQRGILIQSSARGINITSHHISWGSALIIFTHPVCVASRYLIQTNVTPQHSAEGADFTPISQCEFRPLAYIWVYPFGPRVLLFIRL